MARTILLLFGMMVVVAYLRPAGFLESPSRFSLAVAVLLGGRLHWMGLSYLLVCRRDLYERLPPLHGWDAPVRDVLFFAPAFLSWLRTWLGGLLLAPFGSRRTVPLTGRLARRLLLLRLAFAGNASLLAAAALTIALALHARSHDKPLLGTYLIPAVTCGRTVSDRRSAIRA